MSNEYLPLSERAMPIGTVWDRLTRRSFLRAGGLLTMGLLLPDPVFASQAKHQQLSFYHTHTGERLAMDYCPNQYRGAVERTLEYFLRDFRTGEIHSIDPGLLDTLCRIQGKCKSRGSYQVISGYRSPETNELLRQRGSGVAKKSLHMRGQAIDVRLSNQSTKELRDIAASLHNGGVGYYASSDFIHIDTGKNRVW